MMDKLREAQIREKGMDEPCQYVSKEEIEKLALENPIISACVATHRHGKMSWPAALSMMVIALAADNKAKAKMVLELLPYAPPKPIIVGHTPEDNHHD